MTDIVDRLNDSLSAGYSELRKEAAAEITRLRARIEAAEELVRELQRNLGSGMWRVLREEVESWKELAAQFGRDADEAKTHLAFAKDELNHLRTKIKTMEKQEPVASIYIDGTGEHEFDDWKCDLPIDRNLLYLALGAQIAQKAVAYLDLGVGGYMDIGTDLTDEDLAAIPKGRHMLSIVGTYGVDGYVSSQPAPSVPECPYPCGWQNLMKHTIEDGAYLARVINEDEPVTENSRAVTMRMVLRLLDVLMAINNAAPEAKP